MIKYDNKYKPREIPDCTKGKVEPQQSHMSALVFSINFLPYFLPNKFKG